MIQQATHALATALFRHDIPFEPREGGLLLTGSGLRFDVQVSEPRRHPGAVLVQIAIAAQAPGLDGRVLWQSFAGIGPTEDDALGNALAKFLLAPFHVLLAAFASSSREGDTWSLWPSPNGNWIAAGSGLLAQGLEPPALQGFEDVLAGVETAFLASPAAADRRAHWIDLFFGVIDGVRTDEVKLDGEPWPEGVTVLSRWGFDPGAAPYVTGRTFHVLLPA